MSIFGVQFSSAIIDAFKRALRSLLIAFLLGYSCSTFFLAFPDCHVQVDHGHHVLNGHSIVLQQVFTPDGELRSRGQKHWRRSSNSL